MNYECPYRQSLSINRYSKCEIEVHMGKEMGAFELLYDKYASALYGLILQVAPDTYTACRILEGSFVKIWLERASFNSTKSSWFIWMLGITINHCADRLCVPSKTLMIRIFADKSACVSIKHSSQLLERKNWD